MTLFSGCTCKQCHQDPELELYWMLDSREMRIGRHAPFYAKARVLTLERPELDMCRRD